MQTLQGSLSLTARPTHVQHRSLNRRVQVARTQRLTVRAQENKPGEKIVEDADQYEKVPTGVDRTDTRNIEAGNLSNENAERRADIGKERIPSFPEVQAFDGPAPETINGRLCMIACASTIGAEFGSGLGLKEQVAYAPIPILAGSVIIALASYIPIFRGYTRKEAFSTGIFTPKAENWNGRLAMMGFTGILLTEALGGTSTLKFWHIQ
ncbi:hypothetical protein WJX74_000095 [Apatococcus lobatus]|uniref:Uncharacterized protein n=2 Tax=Apatococcus TaxID=904362 RepID=A0AAW1TLK9_9CHLO